MRTRKRSLQLLRLRQALQVLRAGPVVLERL